MPDLCREINGGRRDKRQGPRRALAQWDEGRASVRIGAARRDPEGAGHARRRHLNIVHVAGRDLQPKLHRVLGLGAGHARGRGEAHVDPLGVFAGIDDAKLVGAVGAGGHRAGHAGDIARFDGAVAIDVLPRIEDAIFVDILAGTGALNILRPEGIGAHHLPEPLGVLLGIDGDIDVGDNDVDVVNVDFSTVNEPQPIMKAIVEAANSHPNSDGFITIYDSVDNVTVHSDIEGVTTVRASND